MEERQTPAILNLPAANKLRLEPALGENQVVPAKLPSRLQKFELAVYHHPPLILQGRHPKLSFRPLRGGRSSFSLNMSSFRSISRTVPPTSVSRVSTLNASAHPYGRSPAFRRLLSSRSASPGHEALTRLPTYESAVQIPLLRSQFLPYTILPAVPRSRAFHTTFHSRQDVNSKTTPESKAQSEAAKAEASAGGEDQAKKHEDPQQESDERKSQGEEAEGEGQKNEEKKDDLPPPPPHGDKTPWQVFMETMQTEFKASKEWNDSTKQLAQGATDFVESESVRRAREAYEKTTGAVSSTTGKILKNTAGAVGKGAAWTWDTPVMKGVRKAANVTGEAIDKSTKPIRDTEAFKSVKSVIDDGSSSRYGGWVDKEERRKQRELRDQLSGNGGHKSEVMEEDPKYVGPTLPLFLS